LGLPPGLEIFQPNNNWFKWKNGVPIFPFDKKFIYSNKFFEQGYIGKIMSLEKELIILTQEEVPIDESGSKIIDLHKNNHMGIHFVGSNYNEVCPAWDKYKSNAVKFC